MIDISYSEICTDVVVVYACGLRMVRGNNKRNAT